MSNGNFAYCSALELIALLKTFTRLFHTRDFLGFNDKPPGWQANRYVGLLIFTEIISWQDREGQIYISWLANDIVIYSKFLPLPLWQVWQPPLNNPGFITCGPTCEGNNGEETGFDSHGISPCFGYLDLAYRST